MTFSGLIPARVSQGSRFLFRLPWYFYTSSMFVRIGSLAYKKLLPAARLYLRR